MLDLLTFNTRAELEEDADQILGEEIMETTRWHNVINTLFVKNGKYYLLTWYSGATEYQDDEFPYPAVECEKRRVTYTVTADRYYTIETNEVAAEDIVSRDNFQEVY